MSEEYSIPAFLRGQCTAQRYRVWIFAKATANYKRDSGRGNNEITRQAYRKAIHQAVIASGGVDAYTGLPLDWHLIGTYDNETSREQGEPIRKDWGTCRQSITSGMGLGRQTSRSASWPQRRQNDLTIEEFIELCKQVLRGQGFSITPNTPAAPPEN